MFPTIALGRENVYQKKRNTGLYISSTRSQQALIEVGRLIHYRMMRVTVFSKIKKKIKKEKKPFLMKTYNIIWDDRKTLGYMMTSHFLA